MTTQDKLQVKYRVPKIFLFLFSFLAFLEVAFAEDGLGLSRFRLQGVCLRAVPLQPKPEPKPVAPDGDRPGVVRQVELSYLAPQYVFMAEMERWLKGAASANLPREPLSGGSVGRWVSIGGMALPSISVSKVSWVPQVYAQTMSETVKTAGVK